MLGVRALLCELPTGHGNRFSDAKETLKTETAQTFAKVSVYADQRIGEILRELPKAKAGRKFNEVDVPTQLTKGEAIKQANIEHHTAIDLQAMAANPEVVEAVIAKGNQHTTAWLPQ